MQSESHDERRDAALEAQPYRAPAWRRAVGVLALLVALAGWAVSAFILAGGMGALKRPFFEAVCGGGGAGATWDCHSVLQTRWAYWPEEGKFRLPVAVFGMAYFAAFALWYLFVRVPGRRGRNWHLLPILLVVAGAWESVGFVQIMAFELHRWCALCLTVHGLNALLLLLTFAAWPWREQRSNTAPHPTASLALATATAGILVGVQHLAVATTLMQRTQLSQIEAAYKAIANDPAYVRWAHARQPLVALPLQEDEAFDGDPNAPHTIVVFADFRCTACASAHRLLPKVLEKYAGQVRVAYRHFPQDAACNPLERFKAAGHAGACAAARAAEAARAVGGAAAYRALRDLLFERQNELEGADFAAWAGDLSLDPEAFAAALQSEAVAARVNADIQQGLQLGLAAMPAIYLDGRMVKTGWSEPATWDALLAAVDPDSTLPVPATQP